MSKDKNDYVRNRLWHLIHKHDEVHDYLLEPIVQEMAEDIVHYVKKGKECV